MTTNNRKACVFGGSGFIGRQIVRELARQGYLIKVATRVPESAYFLKTAGTVGQIVPVACNYADEGDIRSAVQGCDVVINCIGVLYEKGKNTFTRLHTELPRNIAKACVYEKIDRFIHISAMACDVNHSKYGKSKRNGELAVLENYPSATILRPSVVFGAEDNFFNMLARLSVVLPFLPLIGGGKTMFSPVYVGDVADSVIACLKNDATKGQIYDLGGPETLSFKGIYERLFATTGRKKTLISLPWGIAKLQGSLLSLLPAPLLTADQVESLKTDNVPGGDLGTLADLGVSSTPMAAILPSYLERYRPGGRFGDKKRA